MPTTDACNIFLIGPRASGKTTLGRELAARLGRPFVDLDAFFGTRYGESIAALVAREGWEAFRDAETCVLRDVAATPGHVVATGGGVVLREENRRILAKGYVIYLQVRPERLAERLLADPNEAQRPSLTGRGLQEEITTVLAEREPLYLALAHAVLAEQPLDALVQEALRSLADRV